MNDYHSNSSKIPSESKNIHHNILTLRRKLLFTQKEFIERFLSDEEGEPHFSLSKYSNFENNGGKDAALFADRIAKSIFVDSDIFYLEPDIFAKNMDLFLDSYFQKEKKENSTDFKRENHIENLVRAISDYLTDGLLSGEFSPGNRIPSDRVLSSMFGVGRTTIREALKVLSVLGLIDIHPSFGTFISTDSSRFLAAPLTWTFFLGEQDINQIITVRHILEVKSAALAAKNLSDSSHSKLSLLFEDCSRAYTEGNFQDFLNLDIDFHLEIAKCSQNSIIHNLLMTSRKLITKISKSGMVNLSQLKDIFDEHSLIYQAIINKNPDDAALKMQQHLSNSLTRYNCKK